MAALDLCQKKKSLFLSSLDDASWLKTFRQPNPPVHHSIQTGRRGEFIGWCEVTICGVKSSWAGAACQWPGSSNGVLYLLLSSVLTYWFGKLPL